MAQLAAFDRGFFVGILVGEGSFGGDGKQPHITLRMHTRHEALFEWLVDRFPATKLYGPYNHGGRSYYQWMARGRALVEDVLPELEQVDVAGLDAHAAERIADMLDKYGAFIRREQARITSENELKLATAVEPRQGSARSPQRSSEHEPGS